jgi:hypothetical protein
MARRPMGERDETCPVSTEGWTKRVQFVREGGGGGGADQMSAPGATRCGMSRPSPVGPLAEKPARPCCQRSAPVVDGATDMPAATLLRAHSPSCREIDTLGIVTASFLPPITTVGPTVLSYTTIATAPAFCTFCALSVNSHTPRLTSATFPCMLSTTFSHASYGCGRASSPCSPSSLRGPKLAHSASTSCSSPGARSLINTLLWLWSCCIRDAAVLCCAPTHSMFLAVAGEPTVKSPASPSFPAAHTARKSRRSRENLSTWTLNTITDGRHKTPRPSQPPPPPSRTKWTRLVPRPVLTGHGSPGCHRPQEHDYRRPSQNTAGLTPRPPGQGGVATSRAESV